MHAPSTITTALWLAGACLALSAYFGLRIHLPGDDPERHMRHMQRSLTLLIAAMTLAFAPMLMAQRQPITDDTPGTVAS